MRMFGTSSRWQSLVCHLRAFLHGSWELDLRLHFRVRKAPFLAWLTEPLLLRRVEITW